MHPSTHAYHPVSASPDLRAKAMAAAIPGFDGPGPWVRIRGDVWARRWAAAPSAGPLDGTLEIVEVAGS